MEYADEPFRRLKGCIGLAALLVGVSACSSPQAPIVIRTGALPSAPGARFVVAEGALAEPWLASADVVRCLEGRGMKASENAEFMVQYSVAVRPANSAVLIGAAADKHNEPATVERKAKGERIVYSLHLDRLSDGERVYALNVDAGYKAKKSSLASRSAQLCASITHSAAG